MKLFTLFTAILISAITFSQNTVLSNKDNVVVAYQATFLESIKKKDRFLITGTLTNNNNYDLYYSMRTKINDKGVRVIDGSATLARVKVQNSRTFIGNTALVSGTKTDLETTSEEVLYVIKANSTIAFETRFRIPKGAQPIVSNTFLKNLMPLSSFDLKLTNRSIQGSWMTNCGGAVFTLNLVQDATNKQFIQQNINGKLINWNRVSETRFERAGDHLTSIIYDKKTASLYYQNVDGSKCSWSKN